MTKRHRNPPALVSEDASLDDIPVIISFIASDKEFRKELLKICKELKETMDCLTSQTQK